MAIPIADNDDPEEESIFSEINITPLTDIFLVLLIIFMVTSSVIATEGLSSGVKVDLPRSATKEFAPGAEKKFLVIGITADGRIAVRGKIFRPEELEEVLKQIALSDPGTLVVLQADGKAFHQQVVRVMDICKRVGLGQLAIATQEE